MYLTALLLIIFVTSTLMGHNSLKICAIVAVVCLGPVLTELFVILRIEKKWNKMPHSHYSHTDEIAYGRAAKSE